MKPETITSRNEFASFLDRLASGDSSGNDWQQFAVTHYPDEFLEEIRRNVVRLYQNSLPLEPDTESANQLLSCWALTIRASIRNLNTDNLETGISICLTQNEAVILDEFLRRYSETGNLQCEHRAEKQALWNLQCLLERVGNRPDWPSHGVASEALAPTEK